MQRANNGSDQNAYYQSSGNYQQLPRAFLAPDHHSIGNSFPVVQPAPADRHGYTVMPGARPPGLTHGLGGGNFPHGPPGLPVHVPQQHPFPSAGRLAAHAAGSVRGPPSVGGVFPGGEVTRVPIPPPADFLQPRPASFDPPSVGQRGDPRHYLRAGEPVQSHAGDRAAFIVASTESPSFADRLANNGQRAADVYFRPAAFHDGRGDVGYGQIRPGGFPSVVGRDGSPTSGSSDRVFTGQFNDFIRPVRLGGMGQETANNMLQNSLPASRLLHPGAMGDANVDQRGIKRKRTDVRASYPSETFSQSFDGQRLTAVTTSQVELNAGGRPALSSLNSGSRPALSSLNSVNSSGSIVNTFHPQSVGRPGSLYGGPMAPPQAPIANEALLNSPPPNAASFLNPEMCGPAAATPEPAVSPPTDCKYTPQLVPSPTPSVFVDEQRELLGTEGAAARAASGERPFGRSEPRPGSPQVKTEVEESLDEHAGEEKPDTSQLSSGTPPPREAPSGPGTGSASGGNLLPHPNRSQSTESPTTPSTTSVSNPVAQQPRTTSSEPVERHVDSRRGALRSAATENRTSEGQAASQGPQIEKRRLNVRVNLVNISMNPARTAVSSSVQTSVTSSRARPALDTSGGQAARKGKPNNASNRNIPSPSETAPRDEEDGTAAKSTIDCPVCGDVAIAHFHYGGMCCYSCKAFFRRVVNTSKATKYKCRSGNNKCDVSLANRRSCQACRYKKCLSAGMKPGLVLSDEQCHKRFGPRRGTTRMSNNDPVGAAGDDGEEDVDDPGEPTAQREAAASSPQPSLGHVTAEDLAMLIDGEKSYEEQNKLGRLLFINLFDTGSVSSDKFEDVELKKYEGITQNIAMIRSFQIERQLQHSRKFVSFYSDKPGEERCLLSEKGNIIIGDVVQTLFDQLILTLKHNKDFNKISMSDQTDLLESNLLTATIISIFEVYSPSSHSLTWNLTENDFNALAKQGIKVLHGRASVTLNDIMAKIDSDLKDEVAKLFKFYEFFARLGLPRTSLYLLLLVVVFSQDCSDVTGKMDIEERRRHFLFSLYETLVQSEGVLGACTTAARLHTALSDLNRMAHLMGQKFISVPEQTTM